MLGSPFLVAEKLESEQIFASFHHDFAEELAARQVWRLRDMNELTERDFIRIYDETYE